jgi:hypothetical protein
MNKQTQHSVTNYKKKNERIQKTERKGKTHQNNIFDHMTFVCRTNRNNQSSFKIQVFKFSQIRQ